MDITYLPNNSSDAFEFNNEIIEVLIDEQNEDLLDMVLKPLKLIPTYWITEFILEKKWKNNFFSIYNNLEIDRAYCREVSPNITIETYNHKYCKEFKKQYEIDFWEQDFCHQLSREKCISYIQYMGCMYS